MFDESLQLLTFITTLGLLVANLRSANAANRNAKIAAREFQLLRRPLVAVKWRAGPMSDDRVLVCAEVSETAGIATTLHSVEAIATLVHDQGMHADVQKEQPNATLSGDTGTHPVVLAFEVPQWLLRRGGSVARLYVTVVVAVDDEEADEETWHGTCTLDFDTERQSYEVTNTRPPLRRLSRRTRAPRSRMVDPVLRAWERFWDSVS